MMLTFTRITMHRGPYYDSVLAIEMKNKILSLFSTMILISPQWLVWNTSFSLFMMSVSLYDVINCDVINVKNFREILRDFF